MSFIPPPDVWLTSHYNDVPAKTIAASGPLTGKTILDVGCGNMLSDFGLLAHGAAHVTGLDIVESVDLGHSYTLLADAGLIPPTDYRGRMTYQHYNGTDFPMEDASFDLVFSWGAFEHIEDPAAVLGEMRRVCKPGGLMYIYVYPWWPCFYGSHLSDYIQEPFFHLKYDHEWVRTKLDERIASHPADKATIEHIYPHFLTLNRYSASRFTSVIRRMGLRILTCSLITYPQHVESLPDDVPLMDAMICGTELVIRP